jgi:hypothetical protein
MIFDAVMFHPPEMILVLQPGMAIQCFPVFLSELSWRTSVVKLRSPTIYGQKRKKKTAEITHRAHPLARLLCCRAGIGTSTAPEHSMSESERAKPAVIEEGLQDR